MSEFRRKYEWERDQHVWRLGHERAVWPGLRSLECRDETGGAKQVEGLGVVSYQGVLVGNQTQPHQLCRIGSTFLPSCSTLRCS